MNKQIFSFLGAILFTHCAFSMGGDKPGPNGGYITMPSTYHLELIEKNSMVRVYLLDIAMKNPIIENSSVTLHFINQETKTVQCVPNTNYFSCKIPAKNLEAYKKIEVESTRKSIKGKVATYNLPLHFE